MSNQYVIENKSVMVNITHPFRHGEITGDLVAQICYDLEPEGDVLDTMDIDFVDIFNIKYMKQPVKDWGKFKEIHMELGIDLDGITREDFDKHFTKENIKKVLKLK